MDSPQSYEGTCFCGAVALSVTGQPAGMGYCHCSSCRTWSASPVNGFTLWPADAVKITRGDAEIATYNKTERSYRSWCKICGGHLFTKHPHWKLTDVYAATIPTFPFKAGVHANYEDAVLHVHDGLTKFKDFPADLGGSGQTLPE